MSGWRMILAATVSGFVLAASVMAFVTVSVPTIRDRPRLGLVVAAVLFLASVVGFALMFRRRK